MRVRSLVLQRPLLSGRAMFVLWFAAIEVKRTPKELHDVIELMMNDVISRTPNGGFLLCSSGLSRVALCVYMRGRGLDLGRGMLYYNEMRPSHYFMDLHLEFRFLEARRCMKGRGLTGGTYKNRADIKFRGLIGIRYPLFLQAGVWSL
jgi:hypothetical protein